jgi:hypothetical protein
MRKPAAVLAAFFALSVVAVTEPALGQSIPESLKQSG